MLLFLSNQQKQSPREVFRRKGALRNSAKFTGKHLCQSLFFSKIVKRRKKLKKKLWHRCFPLNFAKFLRTSFLTEHLRWLLLNQPTDFHSKLIGWFLNDESLFLHRSSDHGNISQNEVMTVIKGCYKALSQKNDKIDRT